MTRERLGRCVSQGREAGTPTCTGSNRGSPARGLGLGDGGAGWGGGAGPPVLTLVTDRAAGKLRFSFEFSSACPPQETSVPMSLRGGHGSRGDSDTQVTRETGCLPASTGPAVPAGTHTECRGCLLQRDSAGCGGPSGKRLPTGSPPRRDPACGPHQHQAGRAPGGRAWPWGCQNSPEAPAVDLTAARLACSQ